MSTEPNTSSGPTKGQPDHLSGPPKIINQLLEELGQSTPVTPPKNEPLFQSPPAEQSAALPTSAVIPQKELPKPTGDPKVPKRHASPWPLFLNFLLIGAVGFLLWERYTLFYVPESPERAFAEMEETVETRDVHEEPLIVTESADATALTQRAPLNISALLLCRSVTGFGVFEPIPDTLLQARHVPHIYVYTEIQHPTPEERDDGRFIYFMTKSTLLYRSDIGPTEPLMDSSISLVVGGRSRRQDFHASQPLQSVRRIMPGEHTVRVTITDQVSGETSTREVSFEVHPD